VSVLRSLETEIGSGITKVLAVRELKKKKKKEREKIRLVQTRPLDRRGVGAMDGSALPLLIPAKQKQNRKKKESKQRAKSYLELAIVRLVRALDPVLGPRVVKGLLEVDLGIDRGSHGQGGDEEGSSAHSFSVCSTCEN